MLGVGARGLFILSLGHAEHKNGGNAKIPCCDRFLHQAVDRQMIVAWKCCDLSSDLAAGDHEQGQNEVAGGKVVFANQSSNRFVLPESSESSCWKSHGSSFHLVAHSVCWLLRFPNWKGSIFPLGVQTGKSRRIRTMFDCRHISVPDCAHDSGLASPRLSSIMNLSRTSPSFTFPTRGLTNNCRYVNPLESSSSINW